MSALPKPIDRPKLSKKDFPRIYQEAHEAGLRALEACVPTPMIVGERTNPWDDSSPIKRGWYVPDGPCGFAWITIRPGNCQFANWLKATGKGHIDHYAGGVVIWVTAGAQSMQKKEAYARAFARVIESYGIYACPDSRLD